MLLAFQRDPGRNGKVYNSVVKTLTERLPVNMERFLTWLVTPLIEALYHHTLPSQDPG